MATEDEINQLRRMTDVAIDDEKYTDAVLNTYIENLGSLAAAAGAIWREKAAHYSSLVDVSESGSSRRLSQLYDQALKMGDHFDPGEETNDTGGISFTVGIERV